MKIVKTTSEDASFRALILELDAYLAEIDGNEHTFYTQYNSITQLQHVIVVFINKKAIACGAFKALNQTTVEIKRMYTSPLSRGKGLATAVLTALEDWATALQYKTCVLETGKRMPDAIALYTKNGYKKTANYGQYIGVANSVCFKKTLAK